MTPAEAIIKKFGGTRPAAMLLGLPPSTVQSWIKAERIPAKRQPVVLAAAQENGIDLTPADFFPRVS